MQELMTIQDVAAYLKMSSQTIYRMAQRGKIPALKVQNRWRFRQSDIESWLTPEVNILLRRVLIVDDDPAIAALFTRALQSKDYKVITAPTGQIAIQKIQKQSFDLIYLDLALPDMGGPKTLGVIRQIDNSVKVVVITGNQESNLLQEILELGPFTVLVKPFGAGEIIETARMSI